MNTSLTCGTGNTSVFTRQWYHNSVALDVDSSVLSFASVEYTHQGLYQCFVHNSAGEASAAAQISVVCESSRVKVKCYWICTFDETSTTG